MRFLFWFCSCFEDDEMVVSFEVVLYLLVSAVLVMCLF